MRWVGLNCQHTWEEETTSSARQLLFTAVWSVSALGLGVFFLEAPTTIIFPFSYSNIYHVAQRMKWVYSSLLPYLGTVASTPPAHCARDHLFELAWAWFLSTGVWGQTCSGPDLSPQCESILSHRLALFQKKKNKCQNVNSCNASLNSYWLNTWNYSFIRCTPI